MEFDQGHAEKIWQSRIQTQIDLSICWKRYWLQLCRKLGIKDDDDVVPVFRNLQISEVALFVYTGSKDKGILLEHGRRGLRRASDVDTAS